MASLERRPEAELASTWGAALLWAGAFCLRQGMLRPAPNGDDEEGDGRRVHAGCQCHWGQAQISSWRLRAEVRTLRTGSVGDDDKVTAEMDKPHRALHGARSLPVPPPNGDDDR